MFEYVSNEAWNFHNDVGVFQVLPPFAFDTIFDISKKP